MSQKRIPKAHLVVTSYDRSNKADSTSKFTINLPRVRTIGTVGLRSAIIPLSYDVFNGDLFHYSVNGSPLTANLTGSYDESNFASYLETAIGVTGLSITMTDTILTFTYSGGDTVVLQFDLFSEKLRSLLGVGNISIDISSSSYIANRANLSGTNVLYLRSNLFPPETIFGGRYDNVAQIPVTGKVGSIMTFVPQYKYEFEPSNNYITRLSEISIEILDEWFEHIDIKGKHVIFEFEV